jgi:uncharacterized damage-inducible protein DinB
MASASHYLTTFAYNNAWANHRLLKACAQLSQADFVAARTSFFPSIKATLNHIVTVDCLYLDMLERSRGGQPPNLETRRFFEPPEPFDTLVALAGEQRKCDARLIALCLQLDDDALEGPVQVPRAAGVYTDQIGRILMHLFEHQIHHRGQAHAMLAGTPVPPPQLDEFYCSNEVSLRAQDFAELGFSEEAIWNRGPNSQIARLS